MEHIRPFPRSRLRAGKESASRHCDCGEIGNGKGSASIQPRGLEVHEVKIRHAQAIAGRNGLTSGKTLVRPGSARGSCAGREKLWDEYHESQKSGRIEFREGS
jgi:hypothetical protein